MCFHSLAAVFLSYLNPRVLAANYGIGLSDLKSASVS